LEFCLNKGSIVLEQARQQNRIGHVDPMLPVKAFFDIGGHSSERWSCVQSLFARCPRRCGTLTQRGLRSLQLAGFTQRAGEVRGAPPCRALLNPLPGRRFLVTLRSRSHLYGKGRRELNSPNNSSDSSQKTIGGEFRSANYFECCG
jgi:hypothetical protein